MAGLIFWYMAKVGEVIYRVGVPAEWPSMTSVGAGRNAAKMMLYYAILRARTRYEGQRAIALYVALGRDGGLDLGIGRDAAAERDGKRIFWLVRIVGRVWAALDLYGQAVTRLAVTGPWEVSVALIKTSGGYLGGFGNGWAEYPDPDANPSHLLRVKPLLSSRARRLAVWRPNTRPRLFRWCVDRRFLGNAVPAVPRLPGTA